MKRISVILAAGALWLVAGLPTWAQGTFWVQLEANGTLGEGERAVRRYGEELDAVNGFRSGNWYIIALGPYSEADAEARRLELLRAGAIPGDAFVADGRAYGSQWWPVGADALVQAPVALPEPVVEPEAPAVPDQAEAEGVEEQAQAGEEAEPTPSPAPEPPKEETLSEARASERALDRDARMALQVALQWEGFYNSGIDGAFGPGTRGAMSRWQEAHGFETTGVLTTRQRAKLLGDYQAVIDSMGLASVTDAQAGIEMVMPASMVAFSHYEAPFAHYDNMDGSGVRLVLISQTGDQNTLFGLYDILQSLEIVPLEGPRERRASDFTIEGTNDEITSYTYARLSGGAVKGFTLIWPNGDDKRRQMALEQMRASFTPLADAVLADNAGLDTAEQKLDLMSGLEIRQPDRNRSGVYVSAGGAVLTTAKAVEGCGRITLDGIYEAEVKAVDAALGVALLTPSESLAPLGRAAFLSRAPRLKSEIAVSGFSYGGRLPAPTLTFGTLADLVGLKGEETLSRLDLMAQDGDAGGPVLDNGGAVMGLLAEPVSSAGQRLPAGVSHAVDSAHVLEFLNANGVTAQTTDTLAAMDPVDMSREAADITVLVSCWN